MNIFEKFKWDAIRKNVVVPAVTRVGSFVTGWLAAQGIPGDHSQAVGLGVAAAALITYDLVSAWLHRRAVEKSSERKGAEKALSGGVL